MLRRSSLTRVYSFCILFLARTNIYFHKYILQIVNTNNTKQNIWGKNDIIQLLLLLLEGIFFHFKHFSLSIIQIAPPKFTFRRQSKSHRQSLISTH